MRTCTKCGEAKPLTEFAKGGSAYRYSGGIMTQCKKCWGAYHRAWLASNPEKRRRYKQNYRRRLREKHFFVYRARQWNERRRYTGTVTPEELARLWKRQRGRCALSGRKLGRDAHLDHIIPRSLGGPDTADNLRWLDPTISHLRNDMPDEELFELCRDVVKWSEGQ